MASRSGINTRRALVCRQSRRMRSCSSAWIFSIANKNHADIMLLNKLGDAASETKDAVTVNGSYLACTDHHPPCRRSKKPKKGCFSGINQAPNKPHSPAPTIKTRSPIPVALPRYENQRAARPVKQPFAITNGDKTQISQQAGYKEHVQRKKTTTRPIQVRQNNDKCG